MFGRTATDQVLEHHKQLIEDLYKKLGEDQKRMFQLAIKTGYQWKNNRWVKRNV